jgi:hypothetical protein
MADTDVDISTIETTIVPTSTNAVMLSESTSKEIKWTLLDDAGINLTSTTNIDHSDHTNGTAQLTLQTTTVSGVETNVRHEETQYFPPKPEGFPKYLDFHHSCLFGQTVRNVGVMFYNNKPGFLKRASVGNFKGDFEHGYTRLFIYGFHEGNVQQMFLMEKGIAEDGLGTNSLSYRRRNNYNSLPQ